MKRVQLFYDVISPYSWVGFELLCRYRSVWRMNLDLCPFLLGAVQKQAGRRNVRITPESMKYFAVDLERTGRHFGIPFEHPKDLRETLFVKGSLAAMRVLTAVRETQPAALEEASRQMWLRVWSRDEDIAGRDGQLAALQAAGLETATAENVLEASQSPETKEALRRTTQEAVDYGAFGTPTIIAHVDGRTELLFGSDRMPLLADVLGEVYSGPMTRLSKLSHES